MKVPDKKRKEKEKRNIGYAKLYMKLENNI